MTLDPGQAWLPERFPFASLGDEVHVWSVRLDLLAPALPALLEILPGDEQAKAARLRFQRDRERYVVSHGVLRCLLGRYLQVEPGGVRFHYGRFGKPSLDPACHQGANLAFSLSHSLDVALCAFARGSEIGVDVEVIKPLPDAEKIAAYAFSESEKSQLADLPEHQRTLAFYHGWTRKEAYLKAQGVGFSQSPDHFSVSIAPEEQARLLQVADKPGEAGRWSFESWAPAPGYVAALAVEGIIRKLRHQQLPVLDARQI